MAGAQPARVARQSLTGPEPNPTAEVSVRLPLPKPDEGTVVLLDASLITDALPALPEDWLRQDLAEGSLLVELEGGARPDALLVDEEPRPKGRSVWGNLRWPRSERVLQVRSGRVLYGRLDALTDDPDKLDVIELPTGRYRLDLLRHGGGVVADAPPPPTDRRVYQLGTLAQLVLLGCAVITLATALQSSTWSLLWLSVLFLVAAGVVRVGLDAREPDEPSTPRRTLPSEIWLVLESEDGAASG